MAVVKTIAHVSPVLKIQEISNLYNCYFVPYSTGPSRSTQIYRCRNFITLYQCKVELRFTYNQISNKIYFQSCDIKHNHVVWQSVNIKLRNTLTQKKREKIQNATKKD